MKSAGQQYPASNIYGQPQGYYGQQGYPGQQYPPVMGPQQQQGPSFVMPQMLATSPMQAPQMKVNVDGSSANIPSWYWGLQGGSMLVGALTNLATTHFNYLLSSKAMEAQYNIYDRNMTAQETIAGYQKEVALQQLGEQGKAIEAQTTMHGEQTRHEQAMGKLEQNTQVMLARIAENGKTDRARILSVSDAFSRRGWDMGLPALG